MTMISTGGGFGHEPGCQCPFCLSKMATGEADDVVINLNDRRHFASLHDWEPDTDYPYPQANNLEHVISVVDIVDAGANTSDSIAVALDMGDRQGGYYTNAAAWLGLVEVDKSTEPYSWHLTGLGQEMRDCDPESRARLMGEMVSRIDDANLLAAEGEDALTRALSGDDLADDTVARRVASMRSWVASTSDSSTLGSAISDAEAGWSTRIAAASNTAREQYEAARRAREAAEPVEEFCGSCFMTLPKTGICDNCA